LNTANVLDTVVIEDALMDWEIILGARKKMHRKVLKGSDTTELTPDLQLSSPSSSR